MKQIGFESEYFIAKDGEKVPAIVPSQLPQDESGILVEVRGKPGNSYEAVSSFVGAYLRMKDLLDELGYYIMPDRRIKLSKTMALELSRQFAKGIYRAQNIYSDTRTHRKNTSYQYAGLHIHFSDNEQRTYYDKKGLSSTVNIPNVLDMPTIVRKMDLEYKDIVAEAFRNVGCYELKGDNFEYRSLPTFFVYDLDDIEILLSIAKFAYDLF